MRHKEVLDNLKQSINKKGLSLIFADSIKMLKDSFNEDVSTKFLRGLSDSDDNRKKTRRISYLMRKNNLSTKRTLNFYKIRGVFGNRAEVVEWGHDKRVKPFQEAQLTDNEKRQISELKTLQEETGLSLFNHAEEDFSDRQKTTDAFNIGGGAVVRDVRVIRVGEFAIKRRSEVLFMVE